MSAARKPSKPILVIGELNADLVMSGLPTMPQLGRELVATGFAIVLGSSSAITAARLQTLGATVHFSGWVGDDDLGRIAVRELQHFGVGTEHVAVVDLPTGVTIALTYPNDRALLTYSGTMEAFDGRNLTDDVLAQYSHLHAGSFFLQTSLQPNLPDIFKRARKLGLTTSLDPGWDPFETWSANPHLAPTLNQTDYFIPNLEEIAAITGDEPPYESVREQIAGALVVKQGKQGASMWPKDGNEFHATAPEVTVVDTTGAGDAFNAGLLYARLIENMPLDVALRFATTCGAQAITEIGGATNAPKAEVIYAMMKEINL